MTALSRLLHSIVFAASLLTAPFAAAQETSPPGPDRERLLAAIAGLASDSVLPEIDALLGSDDPDLRERASRIRRELDVIRGIDLEVTEIFHDGSGSVPPIVEAAGRFLDQLGPPALAFLAARIAEGDAHAIVAAGAGGLVAPRGDLERARELRSSDGTRRRIDQALFRLSRVLGG